MPIRNFQPGDEDGQASVYNEAAGTLPGFKPATAAEVARRHRALPAVQRFYAVEGGRIVGYVLFDGQGRMSFPWCRPGHEGMRADLLAAAFAAMSARGCPTAWVAYRGDWTAVLDGLEREGFSKAREMINAVAEVVRLPPSAVPEDQEITPLEREDWAGMVAMREGPLRDGDPGRLETFYRDNPLVEADSGFALKERRDGRLLGGAILICRDGYADPTRLDAAMPCFRLGALGTERERHKRVDGMFSCVFEDEAAGRTLLGEARRRLEAAGRTHAAAQWASDDAATSEFLPRFFVHQGAFPIYAHPLGRA